MKKIYFDHNATSPVRPEVISEVVARMNEIGNASSTHSFGREARKYVETARRKIAATLNVDSQQIIFNSGATEGNNTVLRGFSNQRVLVSAIEHPSVIESGVLCETIPVTEDGIVDMDALHRLLSSSTPPDLLSVMLVNNETGVIQPVSDIARMAKNFGAMVHCDVVQAYGRISFTRESLGVDFLTLSSHKIGGPQGVGALVIAPSVHPYKLLQGGGQERRQRAGTENVSGISGFGVAAEIACRTISDFQKLSIFRDKIEQHICPSSHVKIYGHHAPRVANTSMIRVANVPSDTLMMAFDLNGIAVGSGSACSSGSNRLSYVLQAMDQSLPPNCAPVRISLGYSTTEKEVEQFLSVWDKLEQRLFKD